MNKNQIFKIPFFSIEISIDPFILFKEISNINSFISFLRKNPQGAFYYFKSLHIYGYDPRYQYSDMEFINYKLNEKFSNFFTNKVAFAQDLFGNQFCFNNNGNIILVNIETLQIEDISTSFDDFDNIVFNNANYLTAWPLAQKWIELTHKDFNFNERLCPKIPFVIGGHFSVNNLYPSDVLRNIDFCSDLYHQIKNLPEGSNLNLRIKLSDP